MILEVGADIRPEERRVEYKILTPEVEEKGTFAAFSGRSMESIKDVEFSRNVSSII